MIMGFLGNEGRNTTQERHFVGIDECGVDNSVLFHSRHHLDAQR